MEPRRVRFAARRRRDGGAARVADWRALPDRRRSRTRGGGPPEPRRVVFTIAPGTRFERIELQFAGAAGIAPAILDDIVDEQDLERELFTDPLVVTELLRRYYREEGYSSAEIDTPRYEYRGHRRARGGAGPRRAALHDPHACPCPATRVRRRRRCWARCRWSSAIRSCRALPSARWNGCANSTGGAAYNDVRPEYALALDRRSGHGRRHVGGRGGAAERDRRPARAGQPEDERPAGQRAARDRDGAAAGPGGARPVAPQSLQHRARSRWWTSRASRWRPIQPAGDPVRRAAAARGERQRNQAGAGRSPAARGAAVPAAVRRVVRHRARPRRHPGRVQSQLAGQGARGRPQRPVRRAAAGGARLPEPAVAALLARGDDGILYYREERNPKSALADPFNVDRLGVSFQQERKLGNAYVWTYGYRYERARKFDPLVGVPRRDRSRCRR